MRRVKRARFTPLPALEAGFKGVVKGESSMFISPEKSDKSTLSQLFRFR
jgi:hypothetical protein